MAGILAQVLLVVLLIPIVYVNLSMIDLDEREMREFSIEFQVLLNWFVGDVIHVLTRMTIHHPLFHQRLAQQLKQFVW